MMSGKEHFLSQLIDKGANIHFKDHKENTILHIVSSSKLGQLAIEAGADVNAQGSQGETPLYKACEARHFDCIYMLLYYGALANIPSHMGLLPFARLSIQEEDDADVLEILLRHTFEGHRNIVKLKTLVGTMVQDSIVFPKLLEITYEIDYNISDLKNLCWCLHYLKPNHFKLFVDKFGFIIQEMIENSLSPLKMLLIPSLVYEIRAKELILILLESNYAAELVRDFNPSDSPIIKLAELWTDNPRLHAEEKELTKIVCLMLSYGLSVTSNDLDEVYAIYGYCELFKILLHMEIKMVSGRKKGFSMAELYYYPSRNIEVFFGSRGLYMDLLSFYNHPKLKELCLRDCVDGKIATKAKSLPSVPSLVELSRNTARKFVIKCFKVKNSMQFYTVVRSLPIPEICKKIIALEKTLY